MYNVRFSISAQEDLKSIEKYIYNSDKNAARIVVEHIIKNIETVLISNPAAGRAGRVLGTRELVITKYPYIVPYLVRENIIYILRVLHTSRKWEAEEQDILF